MSDHAELDNPFWSSLNSVHRGLALRSGDTARYPAPYAPFLGIADAQANAAADLDALIGPATDNRRDAYLETGRDMLEYLERKSEVKFSLYARHPDYQVNRPGATPLARRLAAG